MVWDEGIKLLLELFESELSRNLELLNYFGIGAYISTH